MTKDKKQQKKDELQEWKSLALRLKADYENREKEIAKEKTALRGLVEENLICEFLPVLDNLEKAIEGLNKKDKWIEGVGYVIIQFRNVLRDGGVEEINVSNKEFDPNLAEAVEKHGDGNWVIDVVLKGYKKGDRIIRPAKVIVGNIAEKIK